MCKFSKYIRKGLALCLLFILSVSCLIETAATSKASVNDAVPGRGSFSLESIEFNNPGFIFGMDVSSVLALERAGAIFENSEGEKDDVFKILDDHGINTVRIRVWNDPFDSEGCGYGGGNCDVENACAIGQRAAKYGLRLLIDFHYSDFWADPGKQKAPKNWEDLSVDEKAERIYDFTLDSLRRIRDAGGNISMVQIGNETVSGICGVYDQEGTMKLFSSGAFAVREFDSSVLVALHFTNPEKKDNIKGIADRLNEYDVDYDVFALSYYPFWHGSLENLTEVMDYVAEKYDKYTVVAETSYPYTLDDTDGHHNTVSKGSNDTGEDLRWDFTVEGQASEIHDVMKAVNNVKNKKGLGVFYWEGTWITAGDTTGLTGAEYTARVNENRILWERYGCGWASSYAGEYDPDDAGVYYGGSAVDNQALFSPDGISLESLNAFLYARSGMVSGDVLIGDANLDDRVDISDCSEIQMHLAAVKVLADRGILGSDTDRNRRLAIPDVTHIQYYLAKKQTQYEINIRE